MGLGHKLGVVKMTDLNLTAKKFLAEARANGYRQTPPAVEDLPKDLMLIQSEITEIFEAYRLGETEKVYTIDEHGNFKPDGVPFEFADLAIRVLETMAHYGLDIDALINEKLEYNKTRLPKKF